MKKLYINCAIIGISIIFSSLSGMKKKDHYTLKVQPIGGYISLHKNQKNEGPKTIHFTLVECKDKNNKNDPVAYEYFKLFKPISTLPLNQFTQNKSYKITKDDYTVNFISDRVYEENYFIPNHEYWQKVFNND